LEVDGNVPPKAIEPGMVLCCIRHAFHPVLLSESGCHSAEGSGSSGIGSSQEMVSWGIQDVPTGQIRENRRIRIWRWTALKIAHISTDDVRGGAAQAAYRLHTGLRRFGHDSVMLVAQKSSDDPTVTAFAPPMDFLNRLIRRLRHEQITRSFSQYRLLRPNGYEMFSDDRNSYGATLMGQLPIVDVINLHWIAGFVDHQAFFSTVGESTPVVWTLHDMNAVTGGRSS